LIAAAILQSGKFTYANALYVWGILAGASIGLLASTLGRLYSSVYYSLRDTRTPLYYAIVRLIIATILGVASALYLPVKLGIDPKWGVVGITLASSISGWIEFGLLRHGINRRIGATGTPFVFLLKVFIPALIGALVAWMIKFQIGQIHPVLAIVIILGPFGLIYLLSTSIMNLPETDIFTRRIKRLMGRK
jgi:putative peptidoglycan lipid II flippase